MKNKINLSTKKKLLIVLLINPISNMIKLSNNNRNCKINIKLFRTTTPVLMISLSNMLHFNIFLVMNKVLMYQSKWKSQLH